MKKQADIYIEVYCNDQHYCEVSKYLVLLFMVLYTVKCFWCYHRKTKEQKRKKLNKQIGYVFVIHFLCYLILYLRLGS